MERFFMVDGRTTGPDQAPQPDIRRRLVADAVASIHVVQGLGANTDPAAAPHLIPQVEVGLLRDREDDEEGPGKAVRMTRDNGLESLSRLEVAYGEEYPDLFPNSAQIAFRRLSNIYGFAELHGGQHAAKGVFGAKGLPSEGKLGYWNEALDRGA